MGNTVQQWRVAIEGWTMGFVLTASNKPKESFSSPWYQLLIVLVLLIIGGVEMNPGPTQTVMSTFEKTSGFADMTGELYEIKLSALLFLRALQTRQQFQLASNMKAAGSFDDVVLTLGDCTIFLQLKHKEKTQTILKLSQLTRHKDFNLPKYLKSYLEIKQRWQNNSDLQNCGKFENAKFIIYTNARMHESLVNNVNSAELLDIVSTAGTCVSLTELFDSLPKYKNVLSAIVGSEDIKATPELWEVVQKLYNKQAQVLPSNKQLQEILEHLECLGDLTLYQQFISQLYLCTGQTAEKDLDDHIRREILTICGTDTVLREFMDGMQNWWRSSKCYLTVKAQFFQDIIKKIAANVINDSSTLNVKFLENECNKIRQKFSSGNKNVYLKTDCTVLSCLKVSQSFETNLLVDVNTLKTRLNEVLAVWRLGMCNVLVVEGEITDTDILHKLAIMPDHKCVVVISDNEPRQLYQLFNFSSFTDTFCLSQLDSDSQRDVLDRQVIFQGFPVKLSSLAAVSFLKSSITADVLVQLHHTLKIGQKLDDLDPCYIPRTFLRREYVSELVFTEEQITFAITGISKYRLAQLVPSGEKIQKFNLDGFNKDETCRYILITGEAEFAALCVVNESIHWIQLCEEGFLWIKSKGNVLPVIKHLKQTYISYAGTEKIVALPHQIALIEAQPGMGKSTEMCNIAHVLKHNDPSTWVIKVDLNQFTTLLSQNQVDAMEFLETVSALNTKFQKLLFEHQLQSDANIAILLDAFDEISPNYADQVFYLIKVFAKTNMKKIFVSSRPIIIKKLQQKLSTLAFSFQPFTGKDQQNFLIRYWNQSSINSPALYSFISSLLQLVETSLNDKLKQLTGIPLQCKMLGEIFQDEAIHYCQTGNVRLPQSLNVLQLYDKFFEKKWEIYSEKLYVGMKNAMLHELIQNQKRQFQKSFMNCALVSYLDDYHISRLHSSKNIKKQNNDFISEFNNGKERTGIVTNVIDNKAVFVHRTFTEYFVAMWFSEHFHQEFNNVKMIYFYKSFEIVRKFLDRILSQKFKLHIAVLDEDLVEVKKILLNENSLVNQKDKGGRTPLHLTLQNYFFNKNRKSNDSILETLLEHGADVNCEDKVLRWRPLRLAEEIRAWFAVEKLLEKQANSGNMVWICKNIEKVLCVQNPIQVARSRGFIHSAISVLMLGIGVEYCMTGSLQEVMYTALKNGYVNLIKFIFKCGVSVRHDIIRGYVKTTMLHIAAEHGQLRVVQFLIEKGADVNKNNVYSRVPLMQAAACGHLQIVELLIAHGASVNASDVEGTTALTFSARNGRDEIVKLLIEKGAEINKPSGMFNRTPLMQAAMCFHVPVVELLLIHGAYVNVRDNYGNTPLLLANSEKHRVVRQLLLQNGAHI